MERIGERLYGGSVCDREELELSVHVCMCVGQFVSQRLK